MTLLTPSTVLDFGAPAAEGRRVEGGQSASPSLCSRSHGGQREMARLGKPPPTCASQRRSGWKPRPGLLTTPQKDVFVP